MTDDLEKPKQPVGRPTKYTPELLEATREYMADYKTHGQVIPSIAGLAGVLGVARRTLHAWAKDADKPEFSHILEELLSIQESLLINKGLSSDFNSNIVKLVLGKHGYHDKQDVSVTPVVVNIGSNDADGL